MSSTSELMSLPPLFHTPGSFKYAVTHIFFPSFLPEKNDCTPEDELQLAGAVCGAAYAYTPHVCGTFEEDQWHRIAKMLNNLRASLQSEPLDTGHIVSQLSGMTRGDILTFFIRVQNAAILLTKQENCTLCEAFEVSPHRGTVSKTPGPLICSYPWSAVEIPSGVFDNEEFQSEFACFLSLPNTDDADLPHHPRGHPQYLTMLLAGILQGVGKAADVVFVRKRIRDNVGGWPPGDHRSLNDWRRSSVWLLTRVAIQMSVDRSSPGRAFYKHFVLYFMCSLVKYGLNADISSDLLHLMSSKIFRRLSKLGPSTPDWLSEMVLETCARLREVLDTRWKQLNNRLSPFQNPTHEELVRDTRLSLTSSGEYIRGILSDPDSFPPRTLFHPDQSRRGTLEDFLSSNGTFFDEAYNNNPGVTLFDVGQLVGEKIDDWLACVVKGDKAAYTQLETLMDRYFGKSERVDPEATSIQFLTMIELFIAFDKLAVQEIPMLSDYSPGIPIVWLESLCLCKSIHLHRLSRAYQYLSARQLGSCPGWSVLSAEFTKDSFPIRYFDHSPHLQELKARIEHEVRPKVGTRDKQQPVQITEVDAELSGPPFPTSSLHAKVVVFELQCPPCIHVWRSAMVRIHDFVDSPWSVSSKEKPLTARYLAEILELRPFGSNLIEPEPSLFMQIHFAYFYSDKFQSQNSPTWRYVAQSFRLDPDGKREDRFWAWEPSRRDLRLRYGLGPDCKSREHLEVYINSTSHTSNDILAKQADCPADLPLDEFSVLAHLRSGGLLQWLNILHGLRSRALNLRCREVLVLFSSAISRVGPLDLSTGAWTWHQELQNTSFCDALLDELYSLFAEGAGLIDGVFMSTISLLLVRLLASSPSKEVSMRVTTLLRSIRSKTFHWVQEVSYDLTVEPTNDKRKCSLLHMAATCQGTFDVDHHDMLHGFFHSAEDVDSLLSCAFFIQVLRDNIRYNNKYYGLELLLRRGSLLAPALENSLRGIILADPSDYGVDLAVAKIFTSYHPGAVRWRLLQHPVSHWLMCNTKAMEAQAQQIVQVNLLDSLLRVDGQPCGAFPREIKVKLEEMGFSLVLGESFVVPSDIPEMDFMTFAALSKEKVHFSLRRDTLVVRLQCSQSNALLQLIPPEKLEQDLPPTLVKDHTHWLDLSSKVIEVRSRTRFWDQSLDNWRIDCASGEYRAYRGGETLVDVYSPTWAMISRCFKCFGITNSGIPEPSNILITTSPRVNSNDVTLGLRLFVTLPRHGMAFVVNERKELESCDFKDMTYDENQCIETLLGLGNLLVLRPNAHVTGPPNIDGLIQRCVLIPNCYPERGGDDEVRFTVSATPNAPICNAYNVDAELGCLIGDGSLISIQLLAYLHATSSLHRPDPLTGAIGTNMALRFLQSAGCRSIMKLKTLNNLKDAGRRSVWSLIKCPQVGIVYEEIQMRYYYKDPSTMYVYSDRESGAKERASQRALHLLLSSKVPVSPVSTENHAEPEYFTTEADLELRDVVSAVASAIRCWSINTPIVDTILNWTRLWSNGVQTNTAAFNDGDKLGGQENTELMQALLPVTSRVRDVLEQGERSRRPFQLLFLLPTLAYCSPRHQTAFLSMLMTFALRTKSDLVNISAYTDCKLSDGYRLTEEAPFDHVDSFSRDGDYAISFMMATDAAVTEFIKGWPHDGISTGRIMESLGPHQYDVAGLVASLQQLSSSCFRNRNLKEHLLRILVGPGTPPPPRSGPPKQYTLGKHPQSQVTLDQLLSDRPAPELPRRSILKLDWNRVSKEPEVPNNTVALNRIFSSLPIKSAFRQEYLALLEKSASVRNGSEIAYGLVAKDHLDALQEYYTKCRSNYVEALEILRRSLGPMTDSERLLEQFNYWPPISGDVLLRCLASTSPIHPPEKWNKCLISFALLLLELQRARRLLRLAMDSLEEEFAKELENEQCDGWDPEKYPDWLLIQIQGNFLIRRAQADIAMELMSPESGGNTVMQVNMGEGKSSVIIPIVAAALADGEQLVRVIVPKAQIVQMFELLVARLGWLTNRPIYHLPFSRTPEYREEGPHKVIISLQIDDLEKLISECISQRGILLLQPEHAVSLKLKCIEEQIRACKFTPTDPSITHQKSIYSHIRTALSLRSLPDESFVGTIFRRLSPFPKQSGINDNAREGYFTEKSKDAERVVKWANLQNQLHSYARDILDESDEILHSRFQMVYTIGTAQHMDGYPDRWTIIQQILQLVKVHAETLSRNHPDSVEYERGPPGSFPHIRFVRASTLWPRLTSMIVDDVMAGRLPHFNFQRISCAALRGAIRSFMTKDVLPIPDTAKRVEEYAKNSHQSNLWNGLLLLRGLLSSNILRFALSERRWRVDYGLVPQNPWSVDTVRMMLAVPYRAKDVPAPNTQFGHPDLTIIFTCLCHYYAGLTEEQLRTSFEILLDRDDRSTEYNVWLKECGTVPDWLRTLRDINLRSSEQWDKVTFRLFTRNQAVINFYLSRVVFPREAKEFPWKIGGSSWDLGEKREKLITGFSGTSDSRWLLPMSVTQHDLDHQRGASASVLANLLRPENNFYIVAYENGKRQNTHDFLRLVTSQKPEIRVLLDVGAQILDLSNCQVAQAWLDIARETAAAVYFDENDELMVVARNGNPQPLSSSPFSQRLGDCVAYLDHSHTRGTDLKFPMGSRAAVTLGPGVTKDALVQSCMRMRKLGRGHSVMFFAPPGVDQDIRALTSKQDQKDQITVVDVIYWAVHETWADIEHRAPYWAQQGIDHQSRYDTLSRFSKGELTPQQLSDVWLQPNRKSLVELYGPGKTNDAQIDLSSVPGMQQHCMNLGILSVSSNALEEEQEREVHRQREREQEVELPPMAEAEEHVLHPDVVSFVKTGLTPRLYSGGAFLPVFSTLEKSSAASHDADVWSRSILATVDFSRTIKPESTEGTMDQYLRPVQWILSGKTDHGPVLVVVSPFEANELMPDIRVSQHVHLHLYAPRTTRRMKPSDDLRLYAIPPLPSDWTPPWELIDQLNVFAGQLYLRDYPSYQRLCRFLDVPSSKSSSNTTKVQRNLFNIPGSWEEMEVTFSGSPLPTVMALLAIRTRGKPFAHTHMGRILQGEILTEKDFEEPKAADSDHGLIHTRPLTLSSWP